MIRNAAAILHSFVRRPCHGDSPEHDDALGELLRRGATHDLAGEMLLTIV